MNYFISDTHFYHANIIIYSKRPFLKDGDVTMENGKARWVNKTIKYQRANEMTEKLILNWNSRITMNDDVHHLGDILFGRSSDIINVLRRLNFRTLYFIWGNHDSAMYDFKRIINLYEDLKNRIVFLGNMAEVIVEGQNIILNHYAMATWNKKHRGYWMLCGHSHYGMPAIRADDMSLGKILDVGVDGNNLFPYSFDEIKSIMDKKPVNSSIPQLNDHHTQDSVEAGSEIEMNKSA